MKTFLGKTGIFAIAFVVVNFFLVNDIFSQSQTFDYTGSTQTFTVPDNVISVTIEAWGGGGGGGERNSGFGVNAGGGGGGGGYQTYTYTDLDAGDFFTIIIGDGGAGASNTNNPGSGGSNTIVSIAGETDLVAEGGNGGGVGSFFGGGAGGTGGGTGSGPSGSSGVAGTDGADGNGSGAGGDGGNGATINGGAGATGAANGSNNDAGTAGVPGGGGGGANNDNGSDPSDGAPGSVEVTWIVCTPPDAPEVISPVNLCLNGMADPLTTIDGSGLLWYDVPSGGTGSAAAPTPVTAATGTTTYYVSQTVGCEGSLAQIDVIVNELPVASVIEFTNITCFGAEDGTITVSATGLGPFQFAASDDGINFNWITPSPDPNADSFQITGLGANPYRIKVKDSNDCISK